MAGYKASVGLRGGSESGITIKYFIKSDVALEGILSTNWGYGSKKITGLYEIHKPFPDAAGLDWFYGVGAHIGLYSGSYYGYYGYSGDGYYDNKGKWHSTGYKSNYTSIGIDGIIGLEYQFEEIPFTISLDAKPYIDIIGNSSRYMDYAFSLRYVFK